ncbi:MFS transporter [Brevundimonas sp.]|uniref:MFS transporter n=1 Tax=Brevundimonas sp. TaxID=1871086 RepID=UPI002737E14F|nr:MFS transporter [Brevundimonas sp.]MDP3801854.1 MFS transporter [Brevundimonas sp.]
MIAPAAESDPSHRSRWFILGYGAAQAGAFVCFIPLLTLLLPGKAQLMGGAEKALLLSQMAMLGGLTAAFANVLFGTLSDRTRTPLGRRRPWILGGLVLVALSLGLIGRADSPLQLAFGVVAFQLAVNALFAPLAALVPDMVGDAQKGLISAWAGAALPVANLFTAVVVTRLAGSTPLQFAVVVVVAAALILPFALTLREPSSSRPVPTPLGQSFAALRDRRFFWTFVSRLLVESAVAINTLYLLFLLQDVPEATPPGWSPLQLFGALLIASTLAATISGFVGGVSSDRVRRRRPFVIAGGVGMAAGLALMIGWPQWPGPLAAQVLFGAAHGLHATTVAAMTAEILPDRARAGRDLGVMNMAIALPQSLAPAVAAALLGLGLPLSSVFLAACVAALMASAILAPLRRLA